MRRSCTAREGLTFRWNARRRARRILAYSYNIIMIVTWTCVKYNNCVVVVDSRWGFCSPFWSSPMYRYMRNEPHWRAGGGNTEMVSHVDTGRYRPVYTSSEQEYRSCWWTVAVSVTDDCGTVRSGWKVLPRARRTTGAGGAEMSTTGREPRRRPIDMVHNIIIIL